MIGIEVVLFVVCVMKKFSLLKIFLTSSHKTFGDSELDQGTLFLNRPRACCQE